MIVTILAWTGAFLSCLLTIPQAVRTLRSDQLDGLSATTYWLILETPRHGERGRYSPANTPQAFLRLSTVRQRCSFCTACITTSGRLRASLRFRLPRASRLFRWTRYL